MSFPLFLHFSSFPFSFCSSVLLFLSLSFPLMLTSSSSKTFLKPLPSLFCLFLFSTIFHHLPLFLFFLFLLLTPASNILPFPSLSFPFPSLSFLSSFHLLRQSLLSPLFSGDIYIRVFFPYTFLRNTVPSTFPLLPQ